MRPPLTLRLFRLAVVGACAAASILAQASCARSVSDPVTDGFSTLTPAEAGAVSDGLCISTDCPPPYATCPGSGLCTVNTTNDVHHCGSCENACPALKWQDHATALCAGGKCTFACDEFFADCNQDPSDGCETFVFDDPKNCGACGNACKDGVICWRNACGCPSGFTQCGNDCVKLDSDNNNCGSCGNVCAAPADPSDPKWICGPDVTPPHTDWSCSDSSCKLQCKGGWGDCDNNFCGDGCETNLASDPQNCGACGHACNPGQECLEGACICDAGTRCGDDCVDLQNDPLNCGACGRRCPGPVGAVGGGPGCSGGECTYVCYPGYADCDQDITNGCETNTNTNPLHCGSCTTPCKGGGAQPCVEGKCLSKECEAGVVK
jgi:hypothetical protein